MSASYIQAAATGGMALLLALPAFLVLALLFGAIRPTGLWRDSFDPAQTSPTRIAQFIFILAAAGAALIGLAHSGGTVFTDVPSWLATAGGGGNLAYLYAKWTAARRAAT